MNTIVEFDKNNKWFVIAEKEIDNIKYSYMVRVNDNEDDFLDEYIVVRSLYNNGEEYMEIVNDNLDKIVPMLIPESREYLDIDNLKKVLKEMN